MLRWYVGLLHPLIHLGFGIEFNQPAIIAEGLAQTAVHDDWTGPRFLFPVEREAGGIGKKGKKSMMQLLDEARENKNLAGSAHFEDGNKLRDGVLKRAPEDMIKLAAQWTVSEEQIKDKVAEMVDAAGTPPDFTSLSNILMSVVYFTSTSQRPEKTPKFDFFYIHSVNSSIFFPRFISLPFLSIQTKLRLLEAKGRLDLLMYISRNTPTLYHNEITQYPATNKWNTIMTESIQHEHDDGHLSKLIRALRNGEAVWSEYQGREDELGLKVKGEDWLRIGNMGEPPKPSFLISSGLMR